MKQVKKVLASIAVLIAFVTYTMIIHWTGRVAFHEELLQGMRGTGERLVIIYADDIPTGCMWHPRRSKHHE